jgi:hypothetical protein
VTSERFRTFASAHREEIINGIPTVNASQQKLIVRNRPGDMRHQRNLRIRIRNLQSAPTKGS